MSGILHPTDFSSASALAFDHALALALYRRCPLTLIHVHNRGDAASWSDFPHVRERLAAWGAITGAAMPADLAAQTGIEVHKVEAEGADIARALAHHLERHPHELIVMASEARSGLAGWLKPSVAAVLASSIRAPILVLPEGSKGIVGADGTLKLDRVLVAVDREPDPQAGIDAAARLAGTQAELIALHVGDAPLSPPVAAPAGCDLRVITEPGEPRETIATALRRLDADMLVVVRAGPDGLKEQLFGSTTAKLLTLADRPVLVVPAPSYTAQPRV